MGPKYAPLQDKNGTLATAVCCDNDNFPHAEPQFYGLFGDSADWRHNPLTRQWESVLFPSKVPAGRRDVQLLHAWVSDMVARLKRTAGSLPEESMLKEAQVLFSVAFHEMIRQVPACLGEVLGWKEARLGRRNARPSSR